MTYLQHDHISHQGLFFSPMSHGPALASTVCQRCSSPMAKYQRWADTIPRCRDHHSITQKHPYTNTSRRTHPTRTCEKSKHSARPHTIRDHSPSPQRRRLPLYGVIHNFLHLSLQSVAGVSELSSSSSSSNFTEPDCMDSASASTIYQLHRRSTSYKVSL